MSSTRPVLRRRAPRLLLALFGLLAVLGVWADPVGAHAELQATNPATGAVVPEPPGSITLQYTEKVQVRPDGVRVLDRNGDRVEAGTATANGSVVTAPLDGRLENGTYVVSWRVTSADGHPIRGSYQFSVGERSEVAGDLADQAFADSNDGVYDTAATVLRVVAYVGALFAAGAVLVGAALTRAGEPSPVNRLVAAAAGVGLVALLGQIPLQAALVTGAGPRAITRSGVLSLALAEGLGWATLATGLGLLAIVITTGLPFAGLARVLPLLGAGLVPIGFAVYGHTRTMSPAALGYAADVAHVLAAAVWFGGLVATVVVWRRRRAQQDALGAAEAVVTFSGWAAAVVAAVAVSGLAMGWIEVGGLDGLTGSGYGKLLLAKVALVGVVLAGGAWNRFRLVPRVAASALGAPEDPADPGAWRLLGRIMVLEALALVVVLGLTGILVNKTPGKVSTGPSQVAVTAPLGEGEVMVVVDRTSAGGDIHAYLLTPEGAPDARFEVTNIRTELPAQEVGPFDLTPVRAGPGHYQVVAADFPFGGDWMVTVTVKPDRFTEQTATVTVKLP